jgi:hypothetical protein
MSVSPDFNSPEEAMATYYGEDPEDFERTDNQDDSGGSDSANDSGDDPANWSEAQEEPTDWGGGWMLWYQEHKTEDRRRWFVVRVSQNEEFQALTQSAEPETLPNDTAWTDVPHFDTEENARNVYQEWADENGGESPEEDEAAWTEWEQITTMAGWNIYRREHTQRDTQQFLASGVNQQGETVFLQADGTIGREPHIFERIEEVEAAIQAYQDRQRRGEVPENEQPTGELPDRGRFPSPQPGPGRGGVPEPVRDVVDSLESAVGGRTNALLLVALMIVLTYYAERRGYIDITGTIENLSGGVLDG